MTSLFDPVEFAHGPAMRNRFMLAPLTNQQSLPDGRMSDAEHRWLAMRTRGGYGMMSTCAAGVQPDHAAMLGQLGVFDDIHIDPLRRIAGEMKAHGNVALVQLCHAGLRTDPKVTGVQPRGPYDDPDWGGRAMSRLEIQQLVEDFIVAAERAKTAGFDGVEIHGGHGQVLNQFLNRTRNVRSDGYGGSLEDRARITTEILDGIRTRCGEGFTIGLRLSTERFEGNLAEFRILSERYMTQGKVDFLDMSLWDVFKEPAEEEFRGKPLIAWAMDIQRGAAKVGVAGKINSAARARACIEAGSDFVIIGRAAILHHDFPDRVARDPDFVARSLPISVADLHAEGVSDAFVHYLRQWDGFVAGAPTGLYTYEGDMVDGSGLAVCIVPENEAAAG